jgi:hypothetical protein
MSDGPESKLEQSQPVDSAGLPPTPPPLTMAQHNAKVTERRGNIAADAEKKRKVQALQLQREFILSQRTSSPHRRSALENALADIEEKLAELGWTIHL